MHLPVPEAKVILAMLLYGVSIIIGLNILIFTSLTIGYSFYYASEIIWAMVFRLLPFALGGLASYFAIAWIIIEPVWKHRILNSAIAVAAISMFAIDAKSGAFVCAFPFLITILLITTACVFFSASRFKDGAQR